VVADPEGVDACFLGPQCEAPDLLPGRHRISPVGQRHRHHHAHAHPRLGHEASFHVTALLDHSAISGVVTNSRRGAGCFAD
jgi:hypothetical protein